MRTLVLLRHAKAEPPGEGPDAERALTERGRADAQAAGRWLADQGIRPQLVFCSAARRTRETWEGVAVTLTGARANYSTALYAGGRTEVIDLLHTVPEEIDTVLVIGHNPTMSDVSILLRPYDTETDMSGLRTAGLAVHRTDRAWAQTEPGSMELVLEHTARA